MEYSSFGRRFLAVLIDAVILIIPSALIGGSSGGNVFFGLGTNIIVGLLYYPFFDSSELQGTPGKALLGMIVTSESGERLGFKATVIRYLCKFLSASLMGIGYFMQLFTNRRQTLHDMITESVVIDRDVPDLNYFTVWKVKFKEVIRDI